MKKSYLNRNVKSLYLKYLQLKNKKNKTESDKDNLLKVSDSLISLLIGESEKNFKSNLMLQHDVQTRG
jgi:hypothetical protein